MATDVPALNNGSLIANGFSKYFQVIELTAKFDIIKYIESWIIMILPYYAFPVHPAIEVLNS